MIEALESLADFLCQVQQLFSRSFAAQSSDQPKVAGGELLSLYAPFFLWI